MYVDVDLKRCGFINTPEVFSTERGLSSHWTATGQNSHYMMSASGFRVYVTSPYAWRYRFKYQLAWCAYGRKRPGAARRSRRDPTLSTCCGEARANTWNRYSAEGHIYQDVDLRRCGFTATPQISTSLSGTSSHWVLRGVGATYLNTAQGFRSYIYGTNPEAARAYQYRLSWCATGPTKKRYTRGVRIYDRFNNLRTKKGRICCGKITAPAWHDYSGVGIFTDVDTSKCRFSGRVRYFGSLNGNSGNWTTTGGDAIYSRSATSFRTYIYSHGWALRASHARAYGFTYDWCGIDA